MVDIKKIKRLADGEYGFCMCNLNNMELVEIINSLSEWDFDLLYLIAERAGREEEYYNIRARYSMGDSEAQEFFNTICDEMQIDRIEF